VGEKNVSLCEEATSVKNISSDPTPGPKKSAGPAPKKQKRFIVIEVPRANEQHSYPKAVFACDTLEEALKLCKQMNSDAGCERYGVQRPALNPDK
jgi:hypothetical protein